MSGHLRTVFALMLSLPIAGCVHRADPVGAVAASEDRFNGVFAGSASVVASKASDLRAAATYDIVAHGAEPRGDVDEAHDQGVRITASNGLVTAQDLTTGKVASCPYAYRNGRIEMATTTHYLVYILVNGAKSRSVTLSLDGNGDLLIDDNAYSVGWFLIFPQGFCRNDIYRAKRL